MHNASTGTEMATTTTVVARAALVALLLLAVALVQSTDADSRIHSSSSSSPNDPTTPPNSIPKDAQEGETILLECRFDPSLLGRDADKAVYYWHRTNQGLSKTEPAAINDSPLDRNYRVDFSPEAGRYDLRVDRANYERDNGLFQCKIVIGGTGTVLKEANYLVTILNPPDPPVITPSQAVAKEGEPFRLECSSKGGSPDPTIQWFRDSDDSSEGGRPLEGGELVLGGTRAVPTRNTLTLASPRLEDDGSRYRCVVFNRAYPDEKLEASVRLTVHYKPRITVGPYNPLAVSVDGNAEMSCSVQANPPARSIRWTKGGSIVATTPNHTILRVKPEDSGAYDCSAENAVGRSSAALELSVLHGPIVTIDRVPTATLAKGQEAKAGDHVQLRCTVTSNPPAHRIVWSKVGDPSFKTALGPLLNFAAITADDIGTYVCSATATLTPSGAAASAGVDRTGNATTVLQIQHKPGKTSITPAEPEVVAGRHFTLTCGANPPGYPTPEYEWWREGADLQKLGRRANYTFTALHVTDEGRYFCQPANSHGRGSIASAYMRVNEPASVTLPMKPTHEAKEGDSNFKLTCIGRGKPRPTVVWTHNDVEINPESGEYRVENREQNEDADVKVVTTTLYFEAMARKGANSLSAADRGTYACHFDNGIEREAKSSTVLRVEHTPVVRHTYNRVAFDVGEVAILQCKVSAYPTPRFEWTFGGSKGGSNSNSGTPLDAEHSEGRYGTNSTELPDDLHLGTLSIRSTRESDYGDYTCRATNSAGDDDERTIIKLVKKSPPETPSSLEVLEVLADSVSLRWAEGFNGGFNSNTEFVVNYHDAVQSRNESCRTMNPCKVTGLESRHEYQFRVLAVNPRGFSAYSEPIKVTTKVNLKDMPSAFDSSYDRERNVLSFRVEPNDVSLRLMAKIEVRADGHAQTSQNQSQQTPSQTTSTANSPSSPPPPPNTAWTSLTSVEVLSDLENVYLKSTAEAITDIRVILCLASNESWCGYEHLVKMDSVYRDPRVASTTDHLVSVLLTCAVFAAVAFLLIVCCCLKRREGGKEDEKKVGGKGGKGSGADFESDTSSGGHSGSTSQALGGKGSNGGGLGANSFFSSHDNKGLMSDLEAKTLAHAAAGGGMYGSSFTPLRDALIAQGSYLGLSHHQQQQQHIPQNYYLTGDGSEASPNGSNETGQTEFWNTMKSGQMYGLSEAQQQQAMAMSMAEMGQQELMGYGGYNGAGQMEATQGYMNAYSAYNNYGGGGGGGYQPLDEETLSRKNQMNMYYDEMNGNYHGGGAMTYDHTSMQQQQQQQQQQSGEDMVDGGGYPRARVMSEIIV